MNRLESNLEILKVLERYLIEHPYMRFNQTIYNLILIRDKDLFYEEPQDTLKRLKNKIDNIN